MSPQTPPLLPRSWLAVTGPGRMLLWRVVLGRPQGLRHATLKRRCGACTACKAWSTGIFHLPCLAAAWLYVHAVLCANLLASFPASHSSRMLVQAYQKLTPFLSSPARLVPPRRLQQLQRSERLGPLVDRIQARALRAHALFLQHRAAVLAAHGVVAQPPAAGAAGEPAAEAGQQQQQQEQEQAAAAGEKRKAAVGEAVDDEPASKRQRAGGEEAGEAAEGAAAAGGAKAAAEGAAEAAPVPLPPDADVEGSLRMLRTLLPPDIARQLRKGRLPEVTALLRQLAELTEQVVAAAPKQFKKKVSQAAAGGTARRPPGPKPLGLAARQQLRPGGTQVAARPHSLLKRWAAALRGSGGRPATPAGMPGATGGGTAAAAGARPGPAVTAAMALAESLLYLGAETGMLGALRCLLCCLLCCAALLLSWLPAVLRCALICCCLAVCCCGCHHGCCGDRL